MTALTPEQRSALDALTEKRRAFVLAFIGEARGNATEAARIAGYRKPKEEGARLLTFAAVAGAIEAMRAPAEDEKIATIEELRALWSRWALTGTIERTIDGERVSAPLPAREIIKASELLGKSQGAFIERREITGASGAPLGASLTIVATREQAAALARGETKS